MNAPSARGRDPVAQARTRRIAAAALGKYPDVDVDGVRHERRGGVRQAPAGAVAGGVAPHHVGHLLLGHVFSWANLVACGVGVLAGLAIARLWPRPVP